MALRLWLARIALWRLKHGSSVAPTLLLLVLVAGSGALGYALALHQQWPMSSAHAQGEIPGLAAATGTQAADDVAVRSQSMLARELGRLQSEVVTLRVLFLRLAEVAQLQDGEFDLDMNFSPVQQGLKDDGVELKALDDFRETGKSAYPNDSEASFLQRDSDLPESSQVWGQVSPDTLETSLPLVKQALVHMSEQAARLASVYRERRLVHDFRVSGLPVADAHISSRYGYRVNPVTGRRQLHHGLDLAGKPGSRIMALADGIVTYAGKNGGYGNLVELEHPNGYRTRYAHNHTVLVPLGARVSKGQTIATMGSTGRSTGPHVHVEVRHRGRALDPQLYIR